MSETWREIQQAQEEKRCELVFSGTYFSEKISKQGLDPAIFQVKHLNFLEISKTGLTDLPSDVGELVNLGRLVVCSNNLSSLPPEISKLQKLKFLDVSHNAIAELPSELSKLCDLQSLNVSSNQLTSLPDVSNMIKLVTLNIAFNQFTALPQSVCDSKLIHFTDLIANNNEITEISPNIELLTSLKVFNLAENRLVGLPGELGNCTKLKELNLKGNKLKDKRLLKMVDQCHVKQIMDYIRSHCVKTGDDNKQNKSKKKGNKGKKSDVDEVSI